MLHKSLITYETFNFNSNPLSNLGEMGKFRIWNSLNLLVRELFQMGLNKFTAEFFGDLSVAEILVLRANLKPN